MPALFPLYRLITNLKMVSTLPEKAELATLAASSAKACDAVIIWLHRMC
ncbi:hypothetical protein SPWS13_1726 [Shewanella putrefaciens]|nr:hypothetical protein SPWS13_1726 [Shewanella putrefaciens]